MEIPSVLRFRRLRMRMTTLIVRAAWVVCLIIAAVLVLQGCGGGATATSEAGQGRAAVPAAVPATPTALPPSATATIPSPPASRSSDPPVASWTNQAGSRAITPRVTPTVPGQPTFSEEDVRAFIVANGLDLIRVRAEGPYQIERVTFLPNAQARSQAGIYVGVPDDRTLCLVTVRGTFKLTGPYVPAQTPTVHTFTTMTLIFDGLTGNQLGERGWP
jgi:hypothetical protein